MASASPRRRELLGLIAPAFETRPVNVLEVTEETRPERMVEALARRKAEAVQVDAGDDALIIGADTMVFLDSEPFGKPQSEEDARRMLARLAGRAHAVYTGVCVRNTCTGKCSLAHARTEVHVAPMRAEEIDAYIATGEPMDKAGAYGIQGSFSRYIERIDGCYFNVVGLPVRTTCLLLKEQGWPG